MSPGDSGHERHPLRRVLLRTLEEIGRLISESGDASELDNNPVAPLRRIPVDKREERASGLALQRRINYADRRLQESLHSTDTWRLAPPRAA